MGHKMNLFRLNLRYSLNFLSVTVTRRNFSFANCHRTSVQTTNDAWEPFYSNSVFTEEVETKALKIAIIGLPNAGKSTIINQLIGRKLCPISCKTHTTRTSAKCIQTEGTTQLIYLDTPGLVTEEEFKRFHLSEAFRANAENALREADVIGVVHDAANTIKRLHFDPVLMHLLTMFQSKDSFLILNKVDLVKKKRLLMGISSTLTKDIKKDSQKSGPLSGSWPFFKEIFYVSAENGDGVGDIKAYLLMMAKPCRWPFAPEAVTDRPLGKLIVEALQASMLDALPQEIPRLLKIHLLNLDLADNGSYYATLTVDAKRERHIRIILGSEGLTLRKICSIAETNLSSAFKTPVFLKVAVTCDGKLQ